MVYNRYVHKVFQAGLEVAVQEGVAQYALVFVAFDVQVALQNDFVLCYSTGFVCAQHIHRTEILHGIKALDNGLFFRHSRRALCKVRRNYHRQHLRRKADGNRNSEHKRL